MAYDIDCLLDERVSFDEFKLWLTSESTDDLKSKDDFIACFINYIKENCAWVVSKEGKNPESPTKPVNQQKDENKCPPRGPSQNEEKQSNYNRKSSPKKFEQGFVKNFQNYNGGSSRYDQRKVYNDEKNFTKAHCTAKKSLNFFPAKNAKNCVPYRKNDQVYQPDISNLDAFPPLGAIGKESKPSDSKTRRRITPTPVQAFNKISTNFGASRFNIPPEKANDVFNKTPYVEMPCADLQNEREMLKKTRNEFINAAVINNTSNDLKTENVTPLKKVINYVDPDPNKINKRNQLQTISSVYSILITDALVPNVTSELYFIFELLTSKVSTEDKPNDESSLFGSIHNCMFFGVSVLKELKNLLHLLDQVTLHSLSEIPFLNKFSSEFVNFLQTCSSEKTDIVAKSQTLNRVPFLLEEDSRENFADSPSFMSFRKQRDLFYELLRDWQQQPINNIDTKFHDSFTRKAKLLINLGSNPVNIYHLAKLFQNQLIASCLCLEVNEAYDEFLIDLQQNFPGKLEKLYQRFMMPFCVGEPNPPPTFYGIQTFFSELILAASSTSFNRQLQDILVCKILDLNSADVFSDGELSSLNTMKEKFIFLLHTLRLLGKFLGFVYFLPYKGSENLPANFLNSQLNCRKQSMPPLDTLRLLKMAVEANRVLLTVPWVVEYLSMIDSVGKNLPDVEDTLGILVSIYRGNYISSNSLNIWFLRIMIGWLFDVLRYPPKHFSLLHTTALQYNEKNEGIDSLVLVDKQLIHSCCPYLVEFKVLICNFLKGIKKDKKKEVRKITPLSTSKPIMSASQTKYQIEIQLEENFFFLHSPSMKKTVEFIAERIASKIISIIRTEVTDFKLQTVDSIVQDETYKLLVKDKSNAKFKSFVDSYILSKYEKSQAKITSLIHVECLKDIEHVMQYFFPVDLKPQILEACCKISCRLAVDKIVEWSDANLIFVNISKDIKNKLNHMSKGEEETPAVFDASLYVLISSLRRLIVEILSESSVLGTEHLDILSKVSEASDRHAGYSNDKLVAYLIIDLFIALAVHYPEKCCDECCKKFLYILSTCPKNADLENYFLGVQNIKFLIASKKAECTFKSYVGILENLVVQDIFDSKKVNDSFAKLSSIKWPDSKANQILNLISNIFKKPLGNTA